MLTSTRKGQLEIMGLVVVVILISLGMLFLLKFVVFKPVGEERAAFTRSQLSTNTLNALLITSTDCRADANLKVSDLIQDCAGSNEGCDTNSDSCDFLKIRIEDILEQTLKEWRKEYLFTVYIPNPNQPNPPPKIKVESSEKCPGERDTSLFFLPMEIGSGQILIRLEVCD